MAGSNYTFYRDVTKYGADPTGAKDSTEAINAAVVDGNRCDKNCGNTFAKGAIVYFPVRIFMWHVVHTLLMDYGLTVMSISSTSYSPVHIRSVDP
jgi:hypothetical protein